MKQSHEKTPKHQTESNSSNKKSADHHGSDERSSGKKSTEKGSQSTKMSHQHSVDADGE